MRSGGAYFGIVSDLDPPCVQPQEDEQGKNLVELRPASPRQYRFTFGIWQHLDILKDKLRNLVSEATLGFLG